MVDGEIYYTSTIEYGTPITPEDEPTKEGYTFSGWNDIPDTMPAYDVVVTGSFTINQYLLTYIIDGEEFKSYEVDYNTALTPEPEPVKKGMTFSGWSQMPDTMPAYDLIVTGTFSWSKEIVDGVIYQVTDTLSNYASVVGNQNIDGETEILSAVEIGGDTYTVTSIGDSAFSGCTSMTSVTIPNSVTSINNNAFYDCSGLINIIIGSGVTDISYKAFGNCTSLTHVYCNAENVPKTDRSAFSGSPIHSAILHVPNGSVDLYKAVSPWKDFMKTTPVNSIFSNEPSDNNYYDLNGRKLVGKPTKSGIYIKNGKKVLVK